MKQTITQTNARLRWLILLLLLALASIYTWLTWKYFTIPVPGGNDFVANASVWEPFFQEGISPYSNEAALYTQHVIYGRPATAEEDQNRLVYPFYSIILHGPFAFIDYAMGRAIYMVMLQIALFAGVLMTLDLVRWRPKMGMLTAVLIWALLFYPEARGIILGQFAIFGFFSLTGALFLLKRNQDIAAGALLVVSTIKPPLVFLVIPLLMIWAVVRRRWRFLGSFAGTLAGLIMISLIILPTWISEWLHRIQAYTGYTVGQSPIWLLTHETVPALGTTGETIFAFCLLLGTLLTWGYLFVRGDRSFLWVLGITLVASNLIVPRSATTNYVLLLIPILWGFAILERSSNVWGRRSLILIMVTSLVGLWWLHFATVVGNQEQAIMFIPLPLLLGLALILGRKWFLQDATNTRLSFE